MNTTRNDHMKDSDRERMGKKTEGDEMEEDIPEFTTVGGESMPLDRNRKGGERRSPNDTPSQDTGDAEELDGDDYMDESL